MEGTKYFVFIFRFSINLQCPSISQRHKNETDILFHFNPRFKDEIIVRNSKLCGDWGTEEREGDFIFKVGTEFTIEIESQDENFAVSYLKVICFLPYFI